MKMGRNLRKVRPLDYSKQYPFEAMLYCSQSALKHCESTFSPVHPFSISDSTVNRVHSKGTTYDVDLVLGASLAIFLTICNDSVILTTLSYHVGHFHRFHKT